MCGRISSVQSSLGRNERRQPLRPLSIRTARTAARWAGGKRGCTLGLHSGCRSTIRVAGGEVAVAIGIRAMRVGATAAAEPAGGAAAGGAGGSMSGVNCTARMGWMS
eukprot:scaffold6600_cov125-Isochrysis_galbana.AAC.7